MVNRKKITLVWYVGDNKVPQTEEHLAVYLTNDLEKHFVELVVTRGNT